MYKKIVINKGKSETIIELKCCIEICIQGRDAKRFMVWPLDQKWLIDKNTKFLKEENLIIFKSIKNEYYGKSVWFDFLNKELGFLL